MNLANWSRPAHYKATHLHGIKPTNKPGASKMHIAHYLARWLVLALSGGFAFAGECPNTVVGTFIATPSSLVVYSDCNFEEPTITSLHAHINTFGAGRFTALYGPLLTPQPQRGLLIDFVYGSRGLYTDPSGDACANITYPLNDQYDIPLLVA